MPRREFSTATRKQARSRSGMRCEAVGNWYGLSPGQRCNADLALAGIEYDHFIPDANSHDNSLANCRAVCPKCHRWKTTHVDVPTAAKSRRQELMGMKSRAKAPIKSRGFPKSKKASKRDPKPSLPPRALYETRG